jgi:hypothetical protein
MKRLTTSIVYLLVLFFSNYIVAQSGNSAQKKSKAIPIARLRDAKIVEDLIPLFPSELEIVSCRISIAGKDIKYSEHVLTDHTLPDLFKNVHPGHWMFVEYILVKKKGMLNNKIAAFDPIELVVTE